MQQKTIQYNHRFSLVWWLATRALRNGLKGFRVFIIAIALGVGSIACVFSVSEMVKRAILNNGQELLGGDISISLTHEKINDQTRQWLKQHSQSISDVRTMRTLAIFGETRSLVNLKAVDQVYPLAGQLKLSNHLNQSLSTDEAFKRNDQGHFGAAVSTGVLRALKNKLGDRIMIGSHLFEIRALLENEPDRAINMFAYRPRIMISMEGLDASELDQPGSLIRNHTRLLISDELNATQTDKTPVNLPASVEKLESWKVEFNDAFPDTGWRMRDHRNVSPGLNRFIERIRTFLSLASLTALLVGGLGVVGAVRAHIDRQRSNIAMLLCIGANGRLVQSVYAIHLMLLSFLAILIGLFLGCGIPYLLDNTLTHFLNLPVHFLVDLKTILVSGGFGILSVILFSYPALSQMPSIKPVLLFHPRQDMRWSLLNLRRVMILVLLVAMMIILALFNTDDYRTSLVFALSITGFMGLLYIFGMFAIRLLVKKAKFRIQAIEMGLKNLQRPNSNTMLSIVSLGLGFSVLCSVLLVERNLNIVIEKTLKNDSPSHYFIDIQPDQREQFHDIVDQIDGVRSSHTVPMMRGRITHLNDVPVSEIDPPSDFEWILRGDRGITWMRTPPERGSKIVEGRWWASDHAGPTEVSFDVEAAEAFGLKLNDTITVKVLGRTIRAPITSLRQIDWDGLGINFVLVFSPGIFDRAPQTFLASVYLDQAVEETLEDRVFTAMANVSPIRVNEIMGRILQVLSALGLTIQVI
ncbi:MAG: ABC transporter permease, partial [Pseudomonadota bacterium]